MLEPESRFIILARHGELHNPRGIAYNRDSSMRGEDIMHLSEDGRVQMMLLANTLIERGLKVSKIIASPQIRARESAEELGRALGTDSFEVSDDLDDPYVPGPYLEGMSTDEVKTLAGNYYHGARWEKYNHETPKEVIERMSRATWDISDSLTPGEAGILVSHGDSIAWVANYLLLGIVPNPRDLRNHIYPTKGQVYYWYLNHQVEKLEVTQYWIIQNLEIFIR